MRSPNGAGSITLRNGRYQVRAAMDKMGKRRQLGQYATREDAEMAVKLGRATEARIVLSDTNERPVTEQPEPDAVEIRVQCTCGTIQSDWVDGDLMVKDALATVTCMFCGRLGQCKMVGRLMGGGL